MDEILADVLDAVMDLREPHGCLGSIGRALDLAAVPAAGPAQAAQCRLERLRGLDLLAGGKGGEGGQAEVHAHRLTR